MKDDEKGYQYARDNMLMRQRDIAEEERDSWKVRAMQSEQQRQSLRDLLVIAEGQRDQAKIDAEHWKGEWAVAMGQLGGARAEVEALRKDAALLDALQAEHERFDPVAALVVKVKHDRNGSDWANVIGDVREALTAAMAVQTTTGETHE